MANEKRENFKEWMESVKIKKNSCIITQDVYEQIVGCLQGKKSEIPRNIRRRVQRKKYKLMNYPILDVYNVLCVPSKTETSTLGKYRRVALENQVFDIIERAHVNDVGHQGVLKTFEKVSETYENISREAVSTYIKLCATCCEKSSQFQKSSLKPMFSTGFLQRVQIDVIDMESKPDGEFKYIGHIIDHFSMFKVIFPLAGTSASEFASELVKRFLAIFGVPKILQSHNGPEFVNNVMECVKVLWPVEVSFTAGQPHHSQSEELLELAKSTIHELISAREKDGTNSWAQSLPEIQFIMNCSFLQTIKKSPYKVVFGKKPRGWENMERPVEESVEDGMVDTTS